MKEETYIDKVSGRTLHVLEWNGSTFYYKDPDMRILHREDGPAHIADNGALAWYRNNKIHRMDGPAYIDDNTDIRIWMIDGINVSIHALAYLLNKTRS